MHLKCHKVYQVKPNVFQNGRRCPYCNGGIKLNQEEFLKRLKEKWDNEFVLKKGQVYKNSQTPLVFIHNKCHREIKKKPELLLQKQGCIFCANLAKKTNEQFIKEVYNLVGNEYEVLSDYDGNKKKVKFLHNKCNQVFDMRPRDFLKNNGNRCPYCKESKGEKEISSILDEYNVYYKREYKFKDLRNTNLLSFDFCLFEEKTKKPILIEYDGELHYKTWKEDSESYEHLRRQQENDKIKDLYCQNNGYKLIRIPYWEFNNIRNILLNELELK